MKTESEQQKLDKNLLEAVSKNEITKVKSLLEQRADVNAQKTPSSLTSLLIAVRNRNHELVELLLTNGADPNLKDTFKFGTALHLATKISSTDTKEVSKFEDVISLIKAGTDLKIKNNDGNTFLDLAEKENNGFYIQLINMLANCIDNNEEKKLAFSMGRHPELGKNSLIQTIGEPSIIKKILEKAYPISLDIKDIPENHQEKVKEKHVEIKEAQIRRTIDVARNAAKLLMEQSNKSSDNSRPPQYKENVVKHVLNRLQKEWEEKNSDGPAGGRSI